MERIGVLFVCLGNICRSPLAEGAFRHLVDSKNLTEKFLIDSAATSSWHLGSPPDSRGQQAAWNRGFDIGHQRARKLSVQDFHDFHYILAMDHTNLSHLNSMNPGAGAKVDLILSFSDSGLIEVPDPYYGDVEDFEQVLDLVSSAAEGLLKEIERDHFDT